MAGWRTAFVTGVGSGIGLRLAEKLIAKGTSAAVFDLASRAEVRERLARQAEANAVACSFH